MGGTTTGDHGCTLVGDPVALLQDLPGNRTSFGFVSPGTAEVHGAFEHLGRCPLRLRAGVPTSTLQEAVLDAEVVNFVNNAGNQWVSREQLVIVRPNNEVDWVLDVEVAAEHLSPMTPQPMTPPSPSSPPSMPPPASPPLAAFCTDGYFPLFETQAESDSVSPLGSSHTHEFNATAWYMPDGYAGAAHGGECPAHAFSTP